MRVEIVEVGVGIKPDKEISAVDFSAENADEALQFSKLEKNRRVHFLDLV